METDESQSPKMRDPMASVTIGPVSRWMGDFQIRYRWHLLAIALMLGPIAFLLSNQLDFNRSIESMFAEDDPVLEPYQRLKERFGGNEIVLAVYEDDQLLAEDGSGIRHLHELTQRIRQVEGVQGILSLAEVNEALTRLYAIGNLDPFAIMRNPNQLFGPPSDEGPRTVPIVNPDDKIALEFLEMFEGYTHSVDGKTVSIACILEPKEKNNVSRRKLINDLREVIGKEKQGQLTGEPAMVSDGFTYVKRDGERLGFNCVILLSVVIILCFRSIRWVLIPLAVMQLTLWMTRGLLVVFGVQLSMVSSMLTAIVTVIAVATSMHVILRYREARTVGKNQVESMRSAISLLFWPIFWSCFTDAAGFASLMIATVGPVQDFGLMMAIASLLVLFCIFLLVAPLGLIGKLDADPKRAWGESRMRQVLRTTTTLIARQPLKLALAIGVLALLVSLGNLFLKVETDFTRNFRSDTPIAISYNYVEQKMGGAGVIDVVLPAPNRLNPAYFDRVHQFENELRKLQFPKELLEPGQDQERVLTKVISLADVDAASVKAKGVGSLPLRIRLAGMQQIMPNLFASLFTQEPDSSGQKYYRVMLRTSQRHTADQKQWLVSRIQQSADEHFDDGTSKAKPETTGFYILLSRLVHSILRDQYWTFGVAILGIALVMLVAFRNVTLTFIALVPNLLPILMVMGSLGWLGIKMNMGAAMIAAVSLGLSIDSSIHYLWSFQRWRESGKSVAESVVEAQLRVGRAVVFSTVALVVGFSSLCFSEFVPTIYFGALVSATMLGGLFGNLVVLPILLHLCYGRTDTKSAVPSQSKAH